MTSVGNVFQTVADEQFLFEGDPHTLLEKGQ